MTNKNNNEEFFKNLASVYARKEGQALIEENAMNNDFVFTKDLEKKVSKNISMYRLRKAAVTLAPIAACIALFVIITPMFNNRAPNTPGNVTVAPEIPAQPSPAKPAPEDPIEDKSPADGEPSRLNVELVSAKLPQNYMLSKVDYDNRKIIFYIVNDKNNNIIVTAEENYEVIDKENFTEIGVNGVKAYVMAKKGYNILVYESDGIQYSLTNELEYEDLIRLFTVLT